MKGDLEALRQALNNAADYEAMRPLLREQGPIYQRWAERLMTVHYQLQDGVPGNYTADEWLESIKALVADAVEKGRPAGFPSTGVFAREQQ